MPILPGRYDMTIRSANRSEDFELLPYSRGTVERAPDLPPLCACPVRSQMGLSIGTSHFLAITSTRPSTIWRRSAPPTERIPRVSRSLSTSGRINRLASRKAGSISWTDCLQKKEEEMVYGCSNRTSSK